MLIKLYMPATILLQYLDVNSIEELKKNIREHKISVLRDLLRPSDNDAHTTVCLPLNLKLIYYKVRKSLYGKVLGRDVILYFRKEAPIELESEEEYDIVIELEPNLLERLKLRKFKVIDRFLWTHMIFKCYLHLYDRFSDLIKEFYKCLDSFSDKPYHVCYRATKVERQSLISIHPYELCEVVNVFYPEQLDGLISRIPLLSKTSIFQLSLMLALDDDGFVEMFNLNLSDEFRVENSAKIDEFYGSYSKKLEAVIDELEKVLRGEDSPVVWLEAKVKEDGKLTLNDLAVYAELGIFSYKELLNALHILIKQGKIVPDPEHPEVFILKK